MTREMILLFLARGDGPVTEAVRIFQQEGVVVIKGAIPEIVYLAVKNYLMKAIDEMSGMFALYGLSAHAPDAGRRVEQLLDREKESVPFEHRHALRGHFPLPVRLGRELLEIPYHLSQQRFLHELLDTREVFMHMPPTARFVLPGNISAAVPAHQDVTYNKHLGRFCVVWVPLVEIDATCGGMVVFPRTQGLGELCRNERVPPTEGWIPPIDTAGLHSVEMQPLSPGDIVVMGDETIHASMSNTSERIRLSIDFRFFGEKSRSTKHYLDLQQGCVIEPGVEQPTVR